MRSVLEIMWMFLINHVQECKTVCGKGYSWKCPDEPAVRTVGGWVGIILGVFAAAGIFLGVLLYCACVGRRLPECCKRSNNDREIQLTYAPNEQSPYQSPQRKHKETSV